MNRIILASKSEVRKKILLENGIFCDVEPSKVDEDVIKESLLKEGATPEIISKNLAELKANKISNKKPNASDVPALPPAALRKELSKKRMAAAVFQGG